MPDDKQLKRISNLLNNLQVRTALESSNVSPQYLNNEIARRDAKKIEDAGNKIDPKTKKPYRTDEKWLMENNVPIPGLDSDGVSAINLLDLMGLPGAVKIAGAIGREGIKRGIGRVATNLVNTSSENLSASLKGLKFKDAIKAIIKDQPLYEPMEDEVPYRMMFGLKPRKFTALGEQFSHPKGASFDDIYAINPDNSIRFKPNTDSYSNIKRNMQQNKPPKDFVLGHYNQTGNRYWDKWDVDLNPGELKRNLKAIQNQKTPEDIYDLNSTSIQNYNSIPKFAPEKVITSTGEINQTKLALEKTKSILRLLERAAVRKTVNYFSDPVVIQGTIKGIR